ncbi:MAG: hypothetical protein V4510_10955 [bacterium]
MAKPDGWLKRKVPGLHHFLTRRDKPFPFLREVLFGILAIVLLVALLYGLTGQSIAGGYPVVVVTSGSMMHCTNPVERHDLGNLCDPETYGRVGTIDPGDLVFVRHVSDPNDVSTKAAGGAWHYGGSGDVIVYRPNGDTRPTPIIHRALFWLQVNSGGSVIARESPTGQPITDLQAELLAGCSSSSLRHDGGPDASGFITRGDNNGAADQCPTGGLGTQPVRLTYILGKARGELPWIGLVKLWVDDFTTGTANFANAGGDSKTMLLATVVVLVGTPWGLDLYVRRQAKMRETAHGAAQAGRDPKRKAGETKDRRAAMALSAFLPGGGQAYVGAKMDTGLMVAIQLAGWLLAWFMLGTLRVPLWIGVLPVVGASLLSAANAKALCDDFNARPEGTGGSG